MPVGEQIQAATLEPSIPAQQVTRAPVAQQQAREFGIDEIFFSTTDRKGIIRSGNDVFVRVSGYQRRELVGRPHNLIRHPDMPRCVFKLLWDEIQAGRSIAAYVKNLARDGCYYWVMATVVPCDGGYLSVRLKPSTAYFQVVQGVYRELLALEQQVEAGDASRRGRAIEQSTARLGELLAGAGFATYDAFMRTALLEEVKARELAIGRSASARLGTAPEAADVALRGILGTCAEVSNFVDALLGRLDQYLALNDQLTSQAGAVLDLSEDVKLFSLNALIASTRVSGERASLEAIAGLLRARSDASGPVFEALSADVDATVGLLGSMFFPLAATKLQCEVAMVFVRELIEGGDRVAATADDLGALAQCLSLGTERLGGLLGEVDRRMRSLRKQVARLRREVDMMRSFGLNGRIEAARSSDAEAVVALFQSIAEQVAGARRGMAELAELAGFSFHAEAAASENSQRHVRTIRQHLTALGFA